MTQREYYSVYVKPYLTSDKGFNRQLYNDVKDSLHKDGLITDKQVYSWVYPDNKYFTNKRNK